VAVALVILFSDHSAEYGAVPVASNAAVELPAGTVKVFYREPGAAAGSASASRLSSPVVLQVAPAAGGPALAVSSTSGEGATMRRSAELGATGSLAEFEVPSAGTYVVSSNGGGTAGAELTFGEDRFTAVGRSWRLLVGLLGAALLISLIPKPRRRHPVAAPPAPAVHSWNA
jgi:hypothetical protein